jgi:cytochrome c551/c552
MRTLVSAPAPARLSLFFGDRPAGRDPDGAAAHTPQRGGAPSPVRTLTGFMPDVRKLAVAALCALPLAAAGCGGGDDGGGSGSASSSGEELYRQYACASCHSLDGDDGTGPSFKGLAGSTVKLEGGKEVTADAAYLEKAITDPDADVTEGYNAGLMKASIDGFDLGSKPADVQKLVEYIQGVK